MQIISAAEAKKNKHFQEWMLFAEDCSSANESDAVKQHELNEWRRKLKLIQCDDAQVARLRESVLGTVRQLRNADERRKAYQKAMDIYGPNKIVFMLLETEEYE